VKILNLGNVRHFGRVLWWFGWNWNDMKIRREWIGYKWPMPILGSGEIVVFKRRSSSPGSILMKSIFLPVFLLLFIVVSLQAQTPIIGYSVPKGIAGNQAIPGLGVGNDFQVRSPVTISQLGVFNSGNNGIQGGTVLTVQLYERASRTAGTLLETITFDATSPGTSIDGSLFKPLPTPVTLLPGNYTIAAYGFDTNSPEGNAGRPPYNAAPPLWTVNNGGGLIKAEGLSRYGGDVGLFPGHLDKGPPNRYAAGTFMFSAATLPSPPYAVDYAALTAGVVNFPIEDVRHLGSIAVLDNGAFPVLVEHGGNRQVMEAAGTYNGIPNGGRAVAFSHVQWEHATTDARRQLFENAILWASRKSNPADIVVGITWPLNYATNLDLSYLASRGYQLVPINCLTLDLTNGLPPMDVLLVDGHARYLERATGVIQQFSANGGGMVMSLTPRFVVYPKIRPAFESANAILSPFGMLYRSSLAAPADLTFTNIQTVPQPIYFSAFPAADLLHQDKVGQIKLDSQQKVIALNTITYAVAGQPQLLSELTSVYAGTTNNGVQYPGNAGNLVDVVTLNAAAATTNRAGRWLIDGSDLVAQGSRGIVEYQFNVPVSDVYQIQIFGMPDPATNIPYVFELKLSVDGQNLGRFDLSGNASGGTLQCVLPFLTTGSHTLRIFCDNPRSYVNLRLKQVKVQTRLGPDSDGNGIKDWVDQLLQQESGLDLTNGTIASYTSPVCLEGEDPYLKMMSVYVEGADNKIVNINPSPAPNQRWFANVPLSAYVNAQTVFHVSHQNGGLSETRYLQWLPVNLLTPASFTIRQGDSLLFNAKPTNALTGNLQITIGTNQWNGRTTQPIACQFKTSGTFTVRGTYSRNNATQSGSITVTVVGQSLSNNPDAWVGHERAWNVPAVPSQAIFESDSRLFFESLASLANDGRQFGLMPDQNEPRYVLSRLGTNGPVLDSAKVNGFQLWSGGSTYMKILQVYPDGSQLLEMQLILSPVPADLTVRLDVIVGGVTFDDGTTTRTLDSTSFDGLGRSVVRFIRPVSARTSACHSISIFQGLTLIGYTR
jgi:hypothetical protein